jgi:hypothetical protein
MIDWLDLMDCREISCAGRPVRSLGDELCGAGRSKGKLQVSALIPIIPRLQYACLVGGESNGCSRASHEKVDLEIAAVQKSFCLYRISELLQQTRHRPVRCRKAVL